MSRSKNTTIVKSFLTLLVKLLTTADKIIEIETIKRVINIQVIKLKKEKNF